MYRKHAQMMERQKDTLEAEVAEHKRRELEFGGRMQNLRQRTAAERQRTLADMRRQNRQNITDLRQQHQLGRSLLQQQSEMDKAKIKSRAQQDREKLIRQGKDVIQQTHDRGLAQRLQMQDQHGRQIRSLEMDVHGADIDNAVLEEKLRRQQRAADIMMKTGRAKHASLQDQLQRQRAQAAEMERVGGAQLRSQQDQISGLQRRVGDLTAKGNKLLADAGAHVQNLQNQIDTGNATSASLRDALKKAQDAYDKAKLEATRRSDISAADKKRLSNEIFRLNRDLNNAKADLRAERGRGGGRGGGGGGGGGRPIVVQGGAGGGGASSSAGGSSASGGGSGAAARAPDLSKVVEAVKSIAAAAADKKKKAAGGGGSGTKGITQARRSYTDKRKTKIAELRALKGKRIREFNAKTKKMPKAQRDKARREFKKKVNAQFKEAQQQFPTARGLKTVAGIRELIRKLEAFRPAK